MKSENARSYLIEASTSDIISAAIHELEKPDGDSPVAIRQLANLIEKHAGENSAKKATPVDDSKTHPYIVFVLGGPGSGKGTVCPRLVHDFGFRHLSVGDLLREEVKRQSEIGLEVESIMKSGGLVSDTLALSIIKGAIGRLVGESDSGIQIKVLLDGFPRTLEQAVQFEANVYPAARVLWLTCAEEILMERILERGRSSGRQDDNAESVLLRLKTFNATTNLIKDYYDSQACSKLTVVDSSLSVDAVYEQVKALF